MLPTFLWACVCALLTCTTSVLGGALDTTNTLRKLHDAPELTEDSMLTAYAQAYADKLAANPAGGLQHSGGPYGENLAKIYTFTEQPVQFYVDRAVSMWYAEEPMYNYETGVFSMQAGHFTQLVWQSSRAVGVGVSRNGLASFVVMSFDPPGNVVGAFTRNVIRGASHRPRISSLPPPPPPRISSLPPPPTPRISSLPPPPTPRISSLPPPPPQISSLPPPPPQISSPLPPMRPPSHRNTTVTSLTVFILGQQFTCQPV